MKTRKKTSTTTRSKDEIPNPFRDLFVSSVVVAENPTIDDLKREYRQTYAEYVRQADLLERLGDGGQPDSCTVEIAIVALEAARSAYSAARDRLAERLGGVALPNVETTAGDGNVRHTAHLLWEFSGQPRGSAERDWNRARQLVSAASQSR
jgi:hypothetical protein